MKMYIFFLALLIVITASTFPYVILTYLNSGSSSLILSATPKIEGCALTGQDTRSLTKSETVWNLRNATVMGVGDMIVYDRAISHLCCRTATVSSRSVSESEIIIYEEWVGQACKCMCYSELGMELSNLPHGTYKIKVIEKGKNPDGSLMEETLLISKIVTI